MEFIQSAFFYILAFVSVIAALAVVLSPRIIYSTVALVATFMSVAGIFILLNADFLGLAQIMIYGIGITIIIVFAIMLTGQAEDKKLYISLKPRSLFAVGFLGLLFLILLIAFTNCFGLFNGFSFSFTTKFGQGALTGLFFGKGGSANIIGESLLKNYILPFEIISILLLSVIAGTVTLANRDKSNLCNPTTVPLDNENAKEGE